MVCFFILIFPFSLIPFLHLTPFLVLVLVLVLAPILVALLVVRLLPQILRAATSLVVAASLSPGGGRDRVEKYFKIKKTPERVQDMLRSKMEEGERKRGEKDERRREKAELAKFDVNRHGAGLGEALDKAAGGDFLRHTTYLKYNEGGEEDEELHSDDDDEEEDLFAVDSDEEERRAATEVEVEVDSVWVASEKENSTSVVSPLVVTKRSVSVIPSFALSNPLSMQPPTDATLERLMDAIVSDSAGGGKGGGGGGGGKGEAGMAELDKHMDAILNDSERSTSGNS